MLKNGREYWGWGGWEYEDDAGRHMVVSKRHLWYRDQWTGQLQSACGVGTPRWVARPDSRCGYEPCQRCLSHEASLDATIREQWS